MPFADDLVGQAAVDGLAEVMRRVASDRDWSALEDASRQLSGLGLSERARAVGKALLAGLPTEVDAAEALIDEALVEDDFTGWMIWPVTEAIAELTSTERPQRFNQGLRILAKLTTRLTAEFALRPFLIHDLNRTLAHAQRWARSPDERVRRLASEGTRPHLPWAKSVPALRESPTVTNDILDALYQDASETVRRSVSNHLNDISRLDPAFAVATARRWAADPDDNTARVVAHAMRTLVKQADPGALELLGFGTPQGLQVAGPHLQHDVVRLGNSIRFTVTITNSAKTETRVAIDYVIHFRKANGFTSPRVFKLATRMIGPGQSVELHGTHALRELTTRRHYAGGHALEIQVNGRRHGPVAFDLRVP